MLVAPGQIDAAVGQLDGVARELTARTGVPGLAIAVVHDDKVVYANGFGVRSLRHRARVDANTVFQLASVSKPISATVVAGAVGERTVDWNDRVSTYLEDLGASRAEILRRLRFAPLTPLRQEFAYTNFGLFAGAFAVARKAGTSCETLAERTLYRPLGMTSTSSRHRDFLRRANRATLHVQDGAGRWRVGGTRDPDGQSPAGGVSSSVRDLAQWMRLVLADGKHEAGGW